MVKTSIPSTCLKNERIFVISIKKLLGLSSGLKFDPSKLQQSNRQISKCYDFKISWEFTYSIENLTRFDVVNGNVCPGRLFAEMFLYKRHKHRVFHRCECVHDFSMRLIDGIVSHKCDIHNVVHYGESIDVDNKRIPLRMFYYNQNICMAVLQYDTFECDHSNPDEW